MSIFKRKKEEISVSGPPGRYSDWYLFNDRNILIFNDTGVKIYHLESYRFDKVEKQQYIEYRSYLLDFDIPNSICVIHGLDMGTISERELIAERDRCYGFGKPYVNMDDMQFEQIERCVHKSIQTSNRLGEAKVMFRPDNAIYCEWLMWKHKGDPQYRAKHVEQDYSTF